MVPIHALAADFSDIFASIYEKPDIGKSLKKITKKNYLYFTADGRTALYVALKQLDLKPKDEVIIPAYGCDIVETVVKSICKPIFVDVYPDTYNIDCAKIEETITKNTKAIIPVHLFGNPCDMQKLVEISQKHDLKIVENCAQSLMSKYRNRYAGSFGNSSIFSFRFSKDISCFLGGALATEEELDLELGFSKNSIKNSIASSLLPISKMFGLFPSMAYKKIFSEKLSGKRFPQFEPKMETLSEFQLTMLSRQFHKLENVIEQRRKNAMLYNKLLSEAKSIALPKETPKGNHTYFRYSILTEKRESLKKHLLAKGIHADTMYDYSMGDAKLTNASNIGKAILNLPVHHNVTKKQIKKICSDVYEFS